MTASLMLAPKLSGHSQKTDFSTPHPVVPMPPSVQTVQALYLDFAQGNLSKILAVLDEQTTIYAPKSLPYGGVYKGRDGFIALMTAANKTWDSLRVIPGTAIGNNEEVVITGSYIGKGCSNTPTGRWAKSPGAWASTSCPTLFTSSRSTCNSRPNPTGLWK